eukprot:6172065-Pleurochrysis_carterae.AAC.5
MGVLLEGVTEGFEGAFVKGAYECWRGALGERDWGLFHTEAESAQSRWSLIAPNFLHAHTARKSTPPAWPLEEDSHLSELAMLVLTLIKRGVEWHSGIASRSRFQNC